MEGQADQAEPLLKRAAAAGTKDARVNQNLALVLGLQGKYDEARVVAARDLPAANAAANVDYVRRIVKLEPRPMSQPQPAPPSVAKAPAPRPNLRGPAVDDGAAGWTPTVALRQAVTRAPCRSTVAYSVHDRRHRQQQCRGQPHADRNRRAGVQSPDALVDGCGYARGQ